MIEAFATNCCLYSVLDKSFEFNDANTVSIRSVSFLTRKLECYFQNWLEFFLPYALWTTQHVLFGEIITAQKVMYEKFGNAFLMHLMSKTFPSAHCPQDLAEQYCQKLQVRYNLQNKHTIDFEKYPCPVRKHSFSLLCFGIQGNDIRGLKSYYQSLIENLRLQQNGSHVFR